MDQVNLIRPWALRDNLIKHREGEEFKMIPKIIYRYLSFKRAKDIIETKKLWFSSPNDFNDPYDMDYELIDFSIDRQQAQEFVNRNRPGLNRKERREKARYLIKHKEGFIAHQKQIFEDAKAKTGICCFSRKPDVFLMWSHYANSHKGIVIGFNIAPVRSNPFLMLQPVRYVPKASTKSYHEDKENALSHWILTKSDDWKYEQEIRAFCFLQNGLIGFDINCIKQVYIGCKTSEDDTFSILSSLKDNGYNGVSIKKIETVPKSFDMKIIDVDVI